MPRDEIFRKKKYGISTHAEKDAINKLKYTRKNIFIDIYVLRVYKSGELSYSKPCKNCILYMNKVLKKRRYIINRIYYTETKDKVISTKLKRLV